MGIYRKNNVYAQKRVRNRGKIKREWAYIEKIMYMPKKE